MAALIFLATLLVFMTGGGELLLFGAPKTKVKCVAENHSEEVVDAQTGKVEELENWMASCEILQDDHILYASTPLALPYHASFLEAAQAIEVFRTKTAGKIIHELKEKK